MRIIALAPILLAGCAAQMGDVPERVSDAVCVADELEQFAGQPATQQLGADMLATSRAARLRWAPHNGAITMDFRADRLTVSLTAENRVERAYCG